MISQPRLAWQRWYWGPCSYQRDLRNDKKYQFLRKNQTSQTIRKGKTLQIPAFFENVIPRPVGSFLLPGSSTLKRIWCLIQKQKNLVFQGSILNFSSSSASFFIPVYPRATFNRREKKQFTSSTKIGQTPSLWQHLIKKLSLVSSTIFLVFTSSTK